MYIYMGLTNGKARLASWIGSLGQPSRLLPLASPSKISLLNTSTLARID